MFGQSDELPDLSLNFHRVSALNSSLPTKKPPKKPRNIFQQNSYKWDDSCVCLALMVKTLQRVQTWRIVFKMHITDMEISATVAHKQIPIEVIAFVPISIYIDRK